MFVSFSFKVFLYGIAPVSTQVDRRKLIFSTYMLFFFIASGEPPLLLACSVHCAMREAIRAARIEFSSSMAPEGSALIFQMDVPTTMPKVKELCGLDIIDKYLASLA